MNSVQRKIVIYVVGLVIALVLFTWIKGEFFYSGPGAARQVHPLTIQQGTGASHISIENRNAQGTLQYVMRAELAKPVGGGEYQLRKPELQFYSAKGQSILVDSDSGDILIGATGSGGGQFDNFGNPYLRKGTLTGHVTITVGPLSSFKRGVRIRQPGQIQMTLGKPLHFDYQQGLLISHGSVAVRGDQLQFDGSDMTVEINSANKTLEDLQIAHGKTLVLRGLFQNPSVSSHRPTRPIPRPQTRTNHPAPATTRARIAATKFTTYALTFGRHVNVALGAQTMHANRLRLYFKTVAKAPPAAGNGNVANTGGNTASHAVPVASVKSSSPPHNSIRNPPLVIHWTGPLVLRPTHHSPVMLTGSRDVFMEATGQTGKPVVLRDGPTRIGLAAEVTYNSTSQRVTMAAARGEPIKLSDAAMGTITCATLVYSNLTHQARLTGPGSFEMTGNAAGKNPWHGSWLTNLTVWMVPVIKSAAATAPAIGEGKLAIRRITLSGAARLENAQTILQAQKFMARFIQTEGKNSTSALSYFAADGGVAISSANAGLTAEQSNRIVCGHLIMSTSQANSTANPIPSKLLATHDIAVTFYQKAAKVGGTPEKFIITGGNLQAQLISRNTGAAHAASQASDLRDRYTVGRFRIWNHTVVHIYHIGKAITATASELSGNRQTGTVILEADNIGHTQAAIYQGADWIKGQTIELQRPNEQVRVHGAGVLSMPESSKAAEPRVQVSWNAGMRYSAKTRQAMLTGNVLAELVGRSDQHSSLTAPAMRIHLEPRRKDRKAMKLAQLLAYDPAGREAVVARDVSYSKVGVLQTRMRLQCPKLAYNAVAGLLQIPSAGKMVLEDYRAATNANTAQQRGQSAFAWNQSLTYRVKTGLVHLRGHVRLVFRPVKPLPMAATGLLLTSDTAHSRNAGLVLLDASDLLAQLNHTSSPTKNGVDLGMGGPTRLKKVTANNAVLQVNGLKLAADTLTLNAAKELAQAYGSNGRNAIISNVSGTVHGQARHIIWNLSKAKGGVTLIEPTGTANLP
ncbi:MAG: hypothetical protein ACP5VQ_01355 [Phycisphaerae bacterium]